MGKITSIITFTGKLGNVVGSKGQRGRHLIRARQYEVKNPRSNAQNVQRMIFATAATSLSYLTEILNNSFEGKAFGQESLSYARKVNLDLLRSLNPTSSITGGHFLKKGEKFFAPNAYILSQGTLAEPAYSLPVGTGADFEIKFSNSPTPTAALTASQLFPTIAVGDQITIISVACNYRDYGYEDEPGYTEVRYCRFAFKDDTTPALIAGSDGDFVINPAAIDLVKAKGDWNKLSFATSESGVMYTAGMHSTVPGGLMAAAVLVSNLENNRRSNSRMTVLQPASVLNDWLWHGGDAYPTYGNVAAEQFDFASDVYLNNSARREAADSGSTIQVSGLPAVVSGEDAVTIKIPLTEEPTTVVLNAQAAGGAAIQTGNAVGKAEGANLAYWQQSSDLAATNLVVGEDNAYSDGVYTLQLKSSSARSIVVSGGYVIVNGVRYDF